jgi:hypothetical protein
MTSDKQKELLKVLAEIWELSPDVRMGQLLAHLGFLGEVYQNRSLGYIEDAELLSVLVRHRAELQSRTSAPPTGAGTTVPGMTPIAEATPPRR